MPRWETTWAIWGLGVIMTLYTAAGEQHGLVKTVANSVPASAKESITKKKEYEGIQKENEKVVSARYINHRNKLEPLDVPYNAGPGQPLHMYRFLPNYTYRIPLGLVKQINTQGKIYQGKYISEDNDAPDALESNTPKQVHEMVPVGFS